MSLNKFMHPRNRYKHVRPDFEALGHKYPEFKTHLVENSKGKPVLDFQNPEALRVLTICMMKEDYGLKIELPPDRLVPTLPLRLNYVHWIEDITKDRRKELKGIDIGTGPCCVYALLAMSANPWQFLATEADDVNFSYAQRNVEENKLTKRIKVVKVSSNTILEGVIGQTEDTYDFCMCNPPFFADHFEAQGLVSRSPSRKDAKTMSTASPQEGIVHGGEVGFVRRMIEESNFLQHRVRVYTTMLGKKASLAPLKEILRRYKVTNLGTTEFCQGKTMRWGLGWSFDKSVTFPKSLFSQGKKEGKKSVVHIIPTQVGGRREPVYDLVIFFKQLFSELKIHFREGKQTQFFSLLTLTAAENTWIHSRRKRRHMTRQAAASETCQPETCQPDTCQPETCQPGTCQPETCQSAPTAQHEDGTDCAAVQCESNVNDNAEECRSCVGDDAEQCGNSVEDDAAQCGSSVEDAAAQCGSGMEDAAQCGSSVEDAQCGSGVKDDTRPTPSSIAVEVMCDSTEDHIESAANSRNGKDLNEDPDFPDMEALPDSSTGVENRKRKLVTAESSNSLPTKRLKLQPCAPSSDSRSEELRDRVAVDASLAELSDSCPPKVAEAQSSELEASEKMCTGVESSALSAAGETSCGSVDTALKGVEGHRGKDRPPAEFVLKCHMSVRVQGSDLAVELIWLDGQDIQLMHQLMQFFKNRLAQRKSS